MEESLFRELRNAKFREAEHSVAMTPRPAEGGPSSGVAGTRCHGCFWLQSSSHYSAHFPRFDKRSFRPCLPRGARPSVF